MPTQPLPSSASARPSNLPTSNPTIVPQETPHTRASIVAAITQLPRDVMEKLLLRAAQQLPILANSLVSNHLRASAILAQATSDQTLRIEQPPAQVLSSGQPPSAAAQNPVNQPAEKHINTGDISKHDQNLPVEQQLKEFLSAMSFLSDEKPPQNSGKKRGRKRKGEFSLPPETVAKLRRVPYDFKKQEERVGWLITARNPMRTEDAIEIIIGKILAEIDLRFIVNLEIKHTALLALGNMTSTILNADQTSRKATEVIQGEATSNLIKAMISIVKDMSVNERATFITSKEGVEWKEKLQVTKHLISLVTVFEKSYTDFWSCPQIDDLVELCTTNENEGSC